METETPKRLLERYERVLAKLEHGDKTAFAKDAGLTTTTLRRFREEPARRTTDSLLKIQEAVEKWEAKVGKEDLSKFPDGGAIGDEEFNEVIAGLPGRLVAASQTLNATVDIRKKIKCLSQLTEELIDLVSEIRVRIKRP